MGWGGQVAPKHFKGSDDRAGVLVGNVEIGRQQTKLSWFGKLLNVSRSQSPVEA